MDAGSTAAPPDASAGEAPRCILRTDGRFHALMQVAATAVLVVFALLFPPPGGVAAMYGAVRATGLGLWLATFMAGMVACGRPSLRIRAPKSKSHVTTTAPCRAAAAKIASSGSLGYVHRASCPSSASAWTSFGLTL